MSTSSNIMTQKTELLSRVQDAIVSCTLPYVEFRFFGYPRELIGVDKTASTSVSKFFRKKGIFNAASFEVIVKDVANKPQTVLAINWLV